MRILLIEDDRTIGGAVRDHASADAHAVDWATTLADARGFADVAAYGLVLLDLQLPDERHPPICATCAAARTRPR